MITLYITLPITTSSEERRYITNLFDAQFKRQVASHVKETPGLLWHIEIDLPELVPFTEEQVRYLQGKEFRLISTPDTPCAICEPTTEQVEIVKVAEQLE